MHESHEPLLDTDVANDIKNALKSVFGFNSFRGLQEDIILHILAGKNTFVIMPTGAGKSLCYQIPAIIQPGTALVISPLIALMKNQVDQLNAVGVNAQFLNSTLNKSEMNRVKREVMTGECKLLYVAPESLTKEENLNFLSSANISFVAIDEAHCISEWGHDFRPEYRKIRSIVESLGNLPIIALTATATPKVQQDIQKNLTMEDAAVFKTSFNRKNLFYDVRPKVNVRKQLIKFLSGYQNQAGIIYCLSRKRVEEIAEFLCVNGIKALPYHAGLDPHTRMRNQEAFLNDDVHVICATIAFGMGIDKPDVRFVIHYDAPKSLEGYYQETGRAGRDGIDSSCIMFYSYEDIQKLDKFNKDKNVTERDNARHLLEEMAGYADSGSCRRRQLLNYFGEVIEKDCGFCDNCTKPNDRIQLQAEVVIALQAVQAIGSRFSNTHVADVLVGSLTDYVRSYQHDKLPMYGQGASRPVEWWRGFLRQLMLQGFMDKDPDHYQVYRLNKMGFAYLEAPYPYTYVADHNYTNEEVDTEEERENTANKGHDEELFNMLKELCRKLGKEKKIPPYAIFQDPSLQEMATVYPTTIDALSQIHGVGQGKIQKFGQPFISLINKYVVDNEIEIETDVVVKSSGTKSKNKIYIIQQIDRKVNLDEIAGAKGMPMAELLEEIEHICYSGTHLNLDYYMDSIMDPDRQEEIYDYFMSAESDNMKDAITEFGGEYTEEELRLMRIKFMSEVAM